MRFPIALLVLLTASPAFALSPITQAVLDAAIPAVKSTLLALLSALTALGAVIWVARLVYNRFAPEDFPRFDWKFDEAHEDLAEDMFSDNEFAARQRAAQRLEARNAGLGSLSDEASYYPRLDDH